MKKQLLTAGIAACFLFTGYAQTIKIAPNTVVPQGGGSCATKVPGSEWENAFQKQVSQYKAEHASQRATQAIVSIPVIFHVLYMDHNPVGTKDNLAYAQIASQIDVYNDVFSGNAPGRSNIPYVFQGAEAGNIDIRFCMATKDPNGNILAEPSVERLDLKDSVDIAGWDTTKTIYWPDLVIKPLTIWDPAKYCNIWVYDFLPANGNGLYGWATFPRSSTLSGILNDASLETDTTSGLFLASRIIGSIDKYPSGYYAAGFDKGIASVHEIGHYLGCRHVNGDASCGNDYCDDTPPMIGGHSGNPYHLNWGCPTFPWQPDGCGPGTSPFGEMFMNFMDYSDDACRLMFTQDQKTRIMTAMTNAPLRKYLGTHGLCDAITGIDVSSGLQNMSVYPNPSNGIFTLNGLASNNGNSVLEIHNTIGQLVYKENVGIKMLTNKQVDLSGLPQGIYLLQLSSDLGKFTQRIVIQ